MDRFTNTSTITTTIGGVGVDVVSLVVYDLQYEIRLVVVAVV